MKNALIIAAAFVLVGSVFGLTKVAHRFVVSIEDEEWQRDDYRDPITNWGIVVAADSIPHEYTLARDDYKLETQINAANHGFNSSLQILVTEPKSARLVIAKEWGGRCGYFGPVREFPRWLRFFTEPNSLGFIWATELFCAGVSSARETEIAMSDSSFPLDMMILDADGEILGTESIRISIKNGATILYWMTP